MELPVLIDARGRIVAAADVGFHLGANELEAAFADDLIRDGHVEIYDDRMIPLYCLVDGSAVARSQDEMDADYAGTDEQHDLESRVSALEETVNGEMADQQAALNLLGVYKEE